MNALKRLWSKVTAFFQMLEGMDDPLGDYMFALGGRVEKLERDLRQLEGEVRSHRGA